MDISSRIRGYASFLLCLRDLLVVCSWVLSYWWLVFTHTNLTDLTKYSFIAGFFFHAKRSSPPEGAKGNLANLAKFSFIADFGLTQISRISRKHTSLTLVCTIRLKTLGEADKRGRSDAPSVRFVRSV